MAFCLHTGSAFSVKDFADYFESTWRSGPNYILGLLTPYEPAWAASSGSTLVVVLKSWRGVLEEILARIGG